jgi:high-affinity nickel permease
MLGLDDWIATMSEGGSLLVVLLVAMLLGLRHATDPDHIAAMTTLVASGRDRAASSAARLGAWWGAGHAVTLVLFGVPILLWERLLPERVQQGAETAVAALIVSLGARLVVRWWHGAFAVEARQAHDHEHRHQHRHPVRTPGGAFGVGLVHGIGGSAGVGLLLLAAIPSRGVAILALLLLALFTAVSMTAVTAGLGRTLTARPVASASNALVPALGTVSLAFGLWYAAAAWSLAPYPF